MPALLQKLYKLYVKIIVPATLHENYSIDKKPKPQLYLSLCKHAAAPPGFVSVKSLYRTVFVIAQSRKDFKRPQTYCSTYPKLIARKTRYIKFQHGFSFFRFSTKPLYNFEICNRQSSKTTRQYHEVVVLKYQMVLQNKPL